MNTVRIGIVKKMPAKKQSLMENKTQLNPIKLVAPTTKNGITVNEALNRRHTSREFAPRELELKDLSELLWAAYGINRKPSLKRTVPSAWGLYPLEIYVMTADGSYLYEPEEHKLLPVSAGDKRGLAGEQDFVSGAPVDLMIFADTKKMHVPDSPEMDQKLQKCLDRVMGLDAGAVAENVYLYCASAHLNVVERMMVDENALKDGLGLSDQYRFVVALTVGYAPKG